ncbi:MAG TPA: hypothetical protein VF646_17720, partial [Cytophagales bacterium]
MKNVRMLSLAVLALLLAFTACKRDEIKDVAPAKAPAEELAAARLLAQKWNTKVGSEADVEATLKAYNALSPKAMEAFIEAEAEYRVKVMGEDPEAMKQYLKTRQQWHRVSVAKYGKSFHQITAEQFAGLEKAPEAAGYMDLLKDALRKAKPADLAKFPGARTSENTCPAKFINPDYSACGSPYWYVAAFSDAGTYKVTSSAAARVCIADWGTANKIGQSDCDFYYYFDNLYIQYQANINTYWRGLYGDS